MSNPKRALATSAAIVLLWNGAALGAQPAQPVPLTLQEAVQTALRSNPTYREGATQIASAQAGVRQAAAARGLSVALQGSAQYVNPVATLSTPFGSLPFSPSSFSSTPELSARYVAYDGGVAAARVARAEAQLAQAQSAMHLAREQTIDAVAKSYYQIAAERDLETVASQAVTVAVRHLRDAQERFRAGTVPHADVLRAQMDLADQQVAQIDAENGEAIAQASLDQLMGVPQTQVHVPISPLTAKAPQFDLAALLHTSRVQRPDLAAAESAVDIARIAVAAAQAARRPQVAITASDGNVQPPIERGFHNQFSVGLSAVWTLFDGGYNANAVARAQAGVTDAVLAVQALQSQVELQVRQAYLTVYADQAKVQAARRLVTFADENLRLALVRSEGGVGTPLEVQDAAQRDRDARRTLVQSEADVASAVVDLRSAAGVL